MKEIDVEEMEFQREAKRLTGKTSNDGDKLLAHHLDGIRKALNAHSKNTGKWLGAIATAVATMGSGDLGANKQLIAELRAEADAFEAVAPAKE